MLESRLHNICLSTATACRGDADPSLVATVNLGGCAVVLGVVVGPSCGGPLSVDAEKEQHHVCLVASLPALHQHLLAPLSSSCRHHGPCCTGVMALVTMALSPIVLLALSPSLRWLCWHPRHCPPHHLQLCCQAWDSLKPPSMQASSCGKYLHGGAGVIINITWVSVCKFPG